MLHAHCATLVLVFALAEVILLRAGTQQYDRAGIQQANADAALQSAHTRSNWQMEATFVRPSQPPPSLNADLWMCFDRGCVQ